MGCPDVIIFVTHSRFIHSITCHLKGIYERHNKAFCKLTSKNFANKTAFSYRESEGITQN